MTFGPPSGRGFTEIYFLRGIGSQAVIADDPGVEIPSEAIKEIDEGLSLNVSIRSFEREGEIIGNAMFKGQRREDVFDIVVRVAEPDKPIVAVVKAKNLAFGAKHTPVCQLYIAIIVVAVDGQRGAWGEIIAGFGENIPDLTLGLLTPALVVLVGAGEKKSGILAERSFLLTRSLCRSHRCRRQTG